MAAIKSQSFTGSTTFSFLNVLPIELVQKICSYLDWKTLSALSLTNKRCHSVAVVFLFDTISIHVLDIGRLEVELWKWTTILERNSALSFVHTLKIDDGLYRVGYARLSGLTKQHHQNVWSRHNIDDVTEVGPLQTWSEMNSRPVDDPMIDVDMQQRWGWGSMVQFIQRLPALSHLVYLRADRFPRRLLQVLHQARPQYRLSMRSVNLEPPDVAALDSCSLSTELAPFLSETSLRLDGPPMKQLDKYCVDLATLDQIIERAPKLENLHIWWLFQFDAPGTPPEDTHPGGSLDNPHDQHYTGRLSSLSTLHLRMDRGVPENALEYWAQRTDFSKLKGFKLEGIIGGNALQYLYLRCNFGSLRSLVLNSWWFRSWVRPNADVQYDNLLSIFLQKLRPLCHLRLAGLLSDVTLIAIGTRHGPSLTQLWLENDSSDTDMFCSLDQVRELCQRCVVLENLKIPVRRTKGDGTEVRIYRQLGSIRTLRRLYLNLEIFNRDVDPDSINQSFDSFDRKPYFIEANNPGPQVLRGHIRDVLINAAVDRDLAHAIFNAVCDGKRAQDPPLESLIIQPTNVNRLADAMWDVHLARICEAMATSWSLVRDSRNTHRDDVLFRALSPYASIDLYTVPENMTFLVSIYRRLWPPMQKMPGVGRWIDRWCSFPLATLGAE